MVFPPLVHINAQLFGRIAAVEENLTSNKVVGHNDGCSADLCDIGLKIAAAVKRKDNAVVQCKANDGEHQEDDKLALTAHAFLVLKDILHARQIVEHHGDHKARRVGYNHVYMQAVVEDVHNAKVNDGGNYTHDAKLHDLCDKVLQDIRLTVGQQLSAAV